MSKQILVTLDPSSLPEDTGAIGLDLPDYVEIDER
jgi:hypothetical protein